MEFFTADKHLDHENIIKYCNRPFSANMIHPTREDAYAMTEGVIAAHNKVVGATDDVWDLGDFTFGREASFDRAVSHLKRLNGRKHFMKGNHDKILSRIYYNFPELFESYDDGFKEIEVKNQKIVLCHYSLRTWPHDLKGAWHLYGHSHGTLPPYKRSMDVGVDTRPDFSPYSFLEVKNIMDAVKV